MLHFEHVRSATSGRYRSPSQIDSIEKTLLGNGPEQTPGVESTTPRGVDGTREEQQSVACALLRAKLLVLVDDANLTHDEDLIT